MAANSGRDTLSDRHEDSAASRSAVWSGYAKVALTTDKQQHLDVKVKSKYIRLGAGSVCAAETQITLL